MQARLVQDLVLHGDGTPFGFVLGLILSLSFVLYSLLFSKCNI